MLLVTRETFSSSIYSLKSSLIIADLAGWLVVLVITFKWPYLLSERVNIIRVFL